MQIKKMDQSLNPDKENSAGPKDSTKKQPSITFH